MSSIESRLSREARQTLLSVAAESILYEIEHRTPLSVDPGDYAPELRERRASFVTLDRGGQLYGCIGTIEPREPLVVNVARNAGAAAFKDPRFSWPRLASLDGIDIHISVLSPLAPMRFSSEADLLAQIRPGVDGLLLEEGQFFRGTFLPSVWDSLPEPAAFLAHLKRKAGLAPDYWSSTLTVRRYTVEAIPDDE